MRVERAAVCRGTASLGRHAGASSCDEGFLRSLSEFSLGKAARRRRCGTSAHLPPFSRQLSKGSSSFQCEDVRRLSNRFEESRWKLPNRMDDLRRTLAAKTSSHKCAALSREAVTNLHCSSPMPNRGCTPDRGPEQIEVAEQTLAPVKLTPKERHKLGFSSLSISPKRRIHEQVASPPARSFPEHPTASPSPNASSQKPTLKQRQASRRRNSKRTVTMSLSGSNFKDIERLPSPDVAEVGPLCPSVAAALERFHLNGFTHTEMIRMRICFNRLSDKDGEVLHEKLHEALLNLGYLTITEAKALEIARLTTEYPSLDFQDFVDFCDRCMMYERETLQSKLDQWSSRSELSGRNALCGTTEELQAFMKSLEVLCQKASIKEIRELAGLSGLPCDTAEELLRFIAAWRACEGFRKDELDSIREAFQACKESPKVNFGMSGFEGRKILPGELMRGLLSYGGCYCAGHLRELVAPSAVGLAAAGVSFYEFLVYARRLKGAMLLEVMEQFIGLDEDEDGFLEAADLRELCRSLGFFLVEAEWQELCQATNLAEDAWVDFDSAYDFVSAARERNGFTKAEQEELTGNFSSFCQGEMSTLQAYELLKYQGFVTSIEEVSKMARQMDFDGSGIIDRSKFMRLVRLHREKSLLDYRSAHEKYGLSESGAATPGKVERALRAVHLQPTLEILEQALQLCSRAGDYIQEMPQLSFEAFVRVAETCRVQVPAENRRRAYFKDDEMAQIEHAFAMQDTEKLGYVSIGAFLWQLMDCSFHADTAHGREVIYEQLDRAREAARKAGCLDSQVGNPRSPRVRFLPVVHFVRIAIDDAVKSLHAREKIAVQAAKLSKQDVQGFRALFNSLVRGTEHSEEASPTASPASNGRRHTVAIIPTQAIEPHRAFKLGAVIEHLRDREMDRVPCSQVYAMVTSMGVKTSQEQRLAFSRQLKEASKGSDVIDFPGFLEVMHWVADSNFANTSTAAEAKMKSMALSNLGSLRHVAAAANVQPTSPGSRRMSV
eukprot:TRINITY_DN36873_c0_g1_i1.p1 TRINITY_DN36873_c0_g1~~TRINITY_DN36873_c0_g1_i1.p1  ORF type:complete len:1006 (+),score=187.67 TRINITY_DN36873_c0_g1_i1:87-3104(+)